VEKKDEFVKVVRILPTLKKQQGFLEILPFVPETKTEKMITTTLWSGWDAELLLILKNISRSTRAAPSENRNGLRRRSSS